MLLCLVNQKNIRFFLLAINSTHMVSCKLQKNMMRNRYFYLLLAFCCMVGNTFAQNDTLQIDTIPKKVLPPTLPTVDLIEYNLEMKTIQGKDHLYFISENINGVANVAISEIGGASEDVQLLFSGTATHPMEVDERGKLLFFVSGSEKNKTNRLYHISQGKDQSYRVKQIPLWLSILPPLIAIALALIFKEVIVSLFIGIWTGVFIVGGMRLGSIYYFLDSFFAVVERYVVGALADSGHLSIIIFSLMIGGMVAIISRNGGMAGVVQSLSKYARSARSTQFITWLLGVAIFFDDYANTLIVGNTMRSVSDKYKISREKLAYIVDSTAAPVAAVAFITTWIGAELSYIADATAGLEGFGDMTPYSIFISSLKYSFYPILTLIFILIVIYSKKDYGPMHKAEVRARTTGQVSSAATLDEDEPNMEDLSPVKGAPYKWSNAVIPIVGVILMTLFGLLDTGFASIHAELVDTGLTLGSGWASVWSNMDVLFEKDGASFFIKMGKLIGSSDSYKALLWASFMGVVLAIALTVGQRIMKLHDTMHTLTMGFKTMLPALIILTLAWSLASVTEQLHTADYLTALLKDSINPFLMPVIIFILAAFIAFSTGSSWSTMAILYPIAIPTTWAICQSQGVPSDVAIELVLNIVSIVLAASVVGDHCSPISDTTILSSLASDCNHIDHVRTQMPYALTVGTVSIIAGGLSTYFGGGWLVCILLLLISIAVLATIVFKVGKPIEA